MGVLLGFLCQQAYAKPNEINTYKYKQYIEVLYIPRVMELTILVSTSYIGLALITCLSHLTKILWDLKLLIIVMNCDELHKVKMTQLYLAVKL